MTEIEIEKLEDYAPVVPARMEFVNDLNAISVRKIARRTHANMDDLLIEKKKDSKPLVLPIDLNRNVILLTQASKHITHRKRTRPMVIYSKDLKLPSL